MPHRFRIAILGDIHYACAAEQARGDDFEHRNLTNPFKRCLVHLFRHLVWMRHALRHNAQLDRFIAEVGETDYVIANGDYPCGTNCVGLSDDAMLQSAIECVGRLRQKYGDRLRLTIGDHELGKMAVYETRGGMRLESWRRATGALALSPFWKLELGNYILFGVVSSLIALPIFEPDLLPEERPEWDRLRGQHLDEIRAAFNALRPSQRVLLFCHDPSALPFLWREDAVRAKLPQVEQTIIGHLHSNLVLWNARLLAGLPAIHCLGTAVRRWSMALNEARYWRPFRVRLCPSLAGIELLKDGGFYTAELDAEARQPARFTFHPLPR